MKVYLIRHAAAVAEGPGLPDSYRYLSAEGRTTCRQVGRLLREAGVQFDHVVTSPLVRAVQTGELIADAVDYLGVVESSAAFTPGAHPGIACQELLQRGRSVALVSHAPTISQIAAALVGQPGFAPFRQGQVCHFDSRKPVWRIHPLALQFEDLHIP